MSCLHNEAINFMGVFVCGSDDNASSIHNCLDVLKSFSGTGTLMLEQ